MARQVSSRQRLQVRCRRTASAWRSAASAGGPAVRGGASLELRLGVRDLRAALMALLRFAAMHRRAFDGSATARHGVAAVRRNLRVGRRGRPMSVLQGRLRRPICRRLFGPDRASAALSDSQEALCCRARHHPYRYGAVSHTIAGDPAARAIRAAVARVCRHTRSNPGAVPPPSTDGPITPRDGEVARVCGMDRARGLLCHGRLLRLDASLRGGGGGSGRGVPSLRLRGEGACRRHASNMS
jgi:hypothetical protein